MIAGSLLLGMMILPTIISVSESSLIAVPQTYYEGSRALGASHERSVFLTTLPAAKSGIMAGIILEIGRAIGEREREINRRKAFEQNYKAEPSSKPSFEMILYSG